MAGKPWVGSKDKPKHSRMFGPIRDCLKSSLFTLLCYTVILRFSKSFFKDKNIQLILFYFK